MGPLSTQAIEHMVSSYFQITEKPQAVETTLAETFDSPSWESELEMLKFGLVYHVPTLNAKMNNNHPYNWLYHLTSPTDLSWYWYWHVPMYSIISHDWCHKYEAI